jgi:hypothetical protein
MLVRGIVKEEIPYLNLYVIGEIRIEFLKYAITIIIKDRIKYRKSINAVSIVEASKKQ